MVLLIALNSKYIHTMPSLYYLKNYCKGKDISILDLNVNMELSYMLKKACEYTPDVIGFSCYIFNVETVIRLADSLRKIFPRAKIIFGGPEAGYNKEVAKYADTVVTGEGEEAFKNYLESPENAPRVIYGSHVDMDSLPDIYTEEYLCACRDRILYYESSRGCPFKCAYCMSSLTQKVLYKSLDKVFDEIKKIASYGIKQIKFVDRTFNASMPRAEKIFEYIIENYNDKAINFHFEMAPDLFNENMFALLEKANKGVIQFETGVQSFNKDTLKAINRIQDSDTVCKNIKRLTAMKKIRIHTDLIAGLPLENYGSFKEGFNTLYGLNPDYIQLGFLKVLKGSPLSSQAEKYGIKYGAFPPCRVLCTNDITAKELCALEDIEQLLNEYYNSKRYVKSIEYALQFFKNPFEMFEEMRNFFDLKGYFDRGLSYNARIEYLYNFAAQKGADRDKMFAFLKEDFALCSNNMNFCAFFKGKPH